MASSADAAGDPIPTSAVLMASSKHIAAGCRAENLAFINCKKKDPNPEKCLDKGRDVTRCVLSLLKGLHQRCTKEMDAYASCMYYYTNEFDLCRKEQEEFEKIDANHGLFRTENTIFRLSSWKEAMHVGGIHTKEDDHDVREYAVKAKETVMREIRGGEI